MKDHTPDNQDIDRLVKVLTAHYRVLLSARSDKTLLEQYALLLRALRSKAFSFLDDRREARATRSARSSHVPTISQEELSKATLDDLENLVTDAKTGRKDLEFIAIQRFSVPRGAMRKFSNREMLVDKLRTLIGNERAHETISEVARAQGKRM